MARREQAAELTQGVDQQPETDPALQTDWAVRAAAAQPKAPREDADAALDARPPAVRLAEAGPVLEAAALQAEWALAG